MKMIKILSLLVCVVCLCVLPGAWAVQKLTNQVAPTQSPTPGLTSSVANVPPASLSHTSSAGVQTSTPPLLPAQKKAALINDVRKQSGKKLLEVPPSIDELVLTPSQPSSGNSWLACVKGTFYANPPHGRADVIRKDGGQIELEFNLPLRSGSFYLVDCTVEMYDSGERKENARWKVIGTQTSTIAEEGGHMCFSFRASGPSAHFVIRPIGHDWIGRLYRVELTRVP